MALPRRNHQRYRAALRPSGHADHYVTDALWSAGTTNPFGDPTRKRWAKQAGTVSFHPNPQLTPIAKNGRNDPLSIMYVLEYLLRSNTDETSVSSGAVTVELNKTFGHIYEWDAVTVGRILKGISDIAAGLERPEHAQPPVSTTIYSGALAYIVDGANPAAITWLGCLREYFGRAAVEERMKRRRYGHIPKRDDSIWDGIDARYGESFAEYLSRHPVNQHVAEGEAA